MDAPQRDKLKALALAISKTDSFVGALDALHDFQREASAATVLDLLADRDAMQMERDDLRAEVERLRAVLSALRDGIPLKEPVNISKAVLAQREARVSLSGGTGPVACAMLVNIQLTPWAEGPEKAEAFASGYNTAMKWQRSILLDLAKQVSAGVATRCRAEGGSTGNIGITTSAPAAGTVKDARVLHLTHERDLALRANRELAKDAERYRWLRDNSAGQFEHPIVVTQKHVVGRGMQYIGPAIGNTLDKVVDAAIADRKENA